jgi:hypothetical protein
MRLGFAAPLAAGLLAAAAPPAPGQTFSWNNPAGGNWNVGANWLGGAVPGAGQSAVIDLPGAYTVSLTDNRSIAAVTLNQSTATLEQTGGDLTATGLFTLQAGTLRLTGGRILGHAGVSTAAGTTVRLDGGQLWSISGAGATFNGPVEWSAGELHGPGSTAATFALNGPVNLTGTGTRELESRGLTRLNGGGTWDAGRLIIDAFTTNFELPAGATIVNTTASGNFRLDGDGSVGSVFNLRGTFVKQGTNESMFWQTRVNNSGLLDVQAGTMRVMSHGTHTGGFQVANGATLELNGQEDLNSGHLTVAGGATLVVGWVGNTTTVGSAVSVNIAPTAVVRVVNGGFSLPASATLSPHTLEVAGPVTFTRLTIKGVTAPRNLALRAGGEIWGGTDEGVNNDMFVGGAGGSFTWEAGQFTFVRNVSVGVPASLPGTGNRTLWGSISKGITLNMTLHGGGTWDAGEIKMNGRATITIPAGATVTNTTASGPFNVVPPDATADGGHIALQGTFVKLGANTTTFGRDISIANSGHLDIRAGTVVVSTPMDTTSGGDYTLAPGTTLQVPAVALRGFGANKSLFQGEGTLVSGTVEVTNGGRIRAGTGGPGVLTVAGNSFLSVSAHDFDPPRVIVAAERTDPGQATAGRIDVTGTGRLNLNVGQANRVIQFEVLGTGLREWETYSLTVATAGGGVSRNSGSPLAPGYEFPATEYQLFVQGYPDVRGVRLFLSDANTLTLQFTPAPEPAGLLGVAALAATGWAARRRGRRSVQ